MYFDHHLARRPAPAGSRLSTPLASLIYRLIPEGQLLPREVVIGLTLDHQRSHPTPGRRFSRPEVERTLEALVRDRWLWEAHGLKVRTFLRELG